MAMARLLAAALATAAPPAAWAVAVVAAPPGGGGGINGASQTTPAVQASTAVEAAVLTELGDRAPRKLVRHEQQAAATSIGDGGSSLSTPPARQPGGGSAEASASAGPAAAALGEAEAACPSLYKISGAEDPQPLRMGLFFKQNATKLPLWKNTNEEYLYYSSHYAEWRIGEDYKKELAGVVSTPHQSTHCPHEASGWYAFVHGKWADTYKIQVVAESCPGELWVSGAEDVQRRKMGTFYMTLHESGGRPVYENQDHMFLYFWPTYGEWRIGDDWAKPASGIASKKGEHKQCPSEATEWAVFHEGQWLTSELVVSTRKAAQAAVAQHFHPTALQVQAVMGSSECPKGTFEMTEYECRAAAKALHRDFAGSMRILNKPRGCFRAAGDNGDVTYNAHIDGVGSENAAPICRPAGAPEDPAEASASRRRGDIVAAPATDGERPHAESAADSKAWAQGWAHHVTGSTTVAVGFIFLVLLVVGVSLVAVVWLFAKERLPKTDAAADAAAAVPPSPEGAGLHLGPQPSATAAAATATSSGSS